MLSILSDQLFDAIATGASEKGTWVSLFHPPVEGKLMRGLEGLDARDQVRVHRNLHSFVHIFHS